MEAPESSTGTAVVAAARAAFLATQFAGLAQFDFVVVGVPRPPFPAVRVGREEGIRVELGEPPPPASFTEEQVAALEALGFAREDGRWLHRDPPDDAVALADLVERTLAGVWAVDDADPVDISHGSTRAEHEARAKAAEMRTRIEPVLAAIVGRPAPQDADGDYLVDLGDTRVFVAPRAQPGRPPIIRVFAITNAGLKLTPELGLFLSRLNFSLMFGRFSLDMENQAVWFDETLLGDHVTDEELRFTVEMVASTAGEWDQRIAATFGGGVRPPSQAPTAAASGAEATPPTKPGEGGYL